MELSTSTVNFPQTRSMAADTNTTNQKSSIWLGALCVSEDVTDSGFSPAKDLQLQGSDKLCAAITGLVSPAP